MRSFFDSPGNAAQFLCGSLFVATLSPGLASNIFLFGRFFVYLFCRCCCRFWNVTRCDKDNDDSDANANDDDDDGNVASAMYKIRTIAICNKNMQFFVIVMCGFYRTLTQIRAGTPAHTHAVAPYLMAHATCPSVKPFAGQM